MRLEGEGPAAVASCEIFSSLAAGVAVGSSGAGRASVSVCEKDVDEEAAPVEPVPPRILDELEARPAESPAAAPYRNRRR